MAEQLRSPEHERTKHMAKKTKTPEGAGTPAPAPKSNSLTEAAKARATAAQGDLFRGVPVEGKWNGDKTKFVDPAGRMAPQAMVIINRIRVAGKAGIARKDLVPALVPAGLVTRQPAGRILAYYQKDIVACGAVTVTKAAVTAPTPKAPAAAPATAESAEEGEGKAAE
jgi:hypothetical protein